jgi:hypothetical protein
MKNSFTSGLRLRRGLVLLLTLLGMGHPTLAQLPAAGDGAALVPPPLPGLLPNGLPLPNLPPEAQQDILQRLRDAAAGRSPPLGGPLPAPSAPAMQPQPLQPSPQPAAPALPPLAAAEPLSHTEAFFAGRLGLALRQFGYDSFSATSKTLLCMTRYSCRRRSGPHLSPRSSSNAAARTEASVGIPFFPGCPPSDQPAPCRGSQHTAHHPTGHHQCHAHDCVLSDPRPVPAKPRLAQDARPGADASRWTLRLRQDGAPAIDASPAVSAHPEETTRWLSRLAPSSRLYRLQASSGLTTGPTLWTYSRPAAQADRLLPGSTSPAGAFGQSGRRQRAQSDRGPGACQTEAQGARTSKSQHRFALENLEPARTAAQLRGSRPGVRQSESNALASNQFLNFP